MSKDDIDCSSSSYTALNAAKVATSTTNEKLDESFETAVIHMELAVVELSIALEEVAKWRHPVEGEIAGIIFNAHKKIERLKDLRKDLER